MGGQPTIRTVSTHHKSIESTSYNQPNQASTMMATSLKIEPREPQLRQPNHTRDLEVKMEPVDSIIKVEPRNSAEVSRPFSGTQASQGHQAQQQLLRKQA